MGGNARALLRRQSNSGVTPRRPHFISAFNQIPNGREAADTGCERLNCDKLNPFCEPGAGSRPENRRDVLCAVGMILSVSQTSGTVYRALREGAVLCPTADAPENPTGWSSPSPQRRETRRYFQQDDLLLLGLSFAPKVMS